MEIIAKNIRTNQTVRLQLDPAIAADPSTILFTFALGPCECDVIPPATHCAHGWPSELHALQTALQPQE